MLACARLGAVHSVVFGGFAAHELAARIDDAQPAVIVSASCGVEPTRTVDYKPMLDAALEDRRARPAGVRHPAARPAALRAARRPRPRLARADGRCATRRRGSGRRDRPAVRAVHLRHDRVSRRASSATTAGMRWRCCGACATSTTREPGEVYWAASDVGWVVGHSYIVYAPLLLGATTVLYEGKPVGTPDAGAFWRVASEHRVKALFTAPTAIRAIKKEDPEGLHLAQVRPVGVEVSVPGRRAPRPRHLRTGRRTYSASRSSTTGGRPRPAGRSPPTRWASSRCRSSPARRRCRCRLRRADPAARRIGVRCGRGGRDLRTAAAAAGHPADVMGRRRPLRLLLSVERSRATT